MDLGAAPSRLAVDGSSGILYILSEYDAALIVVDTSTRSLVRRIDLDSAPTDLVLDESKGVVYVTNAEEGTVTVVDAATYCVRNTVTIGSGLSGLAIGPGFLYVVNTEDQTLAALNLATNQVIETLRIGGRPGRLARRALTGTLYVTNGDSVLLAIDNMASSAKLSIDAIPLGAAGSADIAVEERSGIVYVGGEGVVQAVDTVIRTITDVLPVGSFQPCLAVDNSTGFLYVTHEEGTVWAVDTRDNTLVDWVTVRGYTNGIAVDSITGNLFVSSIDEGTVSFVVREFH